MKLIFHNRSLFLIDFILNVSFVVLFLPILNSAAEYAMLLTGHPYLTVGNVLHFLTSWPVLIFLFLLLFVILTFLLSKLTSLIFYCNTEGSPKKLYLPRIISFGLFKTLHMIKNGNIPLLLFSVPFYILTNLPLLIGITYYADLEFHGGLHDEIFIKGLVIAFLLLIGFISFRGLFVFHCCMNEHLSFSDGLKHSKELLTGRGRRTFLSFFTLNLLIAGIFVLFYYLLLFITAISVYFFTNKSMVITVFLSAYPKINLYATLFFSMIAFVVNVNLITSMYRTYQEDNFQDILQNDTYLEESVYYRIKQNKLLVNVLFLLIIALGFFNFYRTIRNDSLSLGEAFTGIQISSHRGNSHVAPENTIPALENAIRAYSDYAEIDIQQTKDGELILLHDKTLLRTAGLNRYIWDLTKEELNNLDAGSWFGKEFLNTRIPTLEDVLIYCKGQIKLNIDIKTNGKEENLEEKLVDLIRQYEYEHQCIVSSTDYSSLVKIKLLEGNIKTGLILPSVYGNFYEKEYLDFFSIRSGYITKNVVDNAHRVGKEIHAWTVNSPREIERMKALGVDCIITDNPVMVREIVYRDDTNENFIQLLKRMLKNKSLYRISQLFN